MTILCLVSTLRLFVLPRLLWTLLCLFILWNRSQDYCHLWCCHKRPRPKMVTSRPVHVTALEATTLLTLFPKSWIILRMIVLHSTSQCDICLEPYTCSGSYDTPYGISCGHIFCYRWAWSDVSRRRLLLYTVYPGAFSVWDQLFVLCAGSLLH